MRNRITDRGGILFWAMALLACASYAQVGGPGTVTLPGVLGGAAVDLSGYVLLAGDEDGQMIQGLSGADRARIDLAVGDSLSVQLFGSGAAPASVQAGATSAGVYSGDGSSNFLVDSNYAEVNSGTGPFSLTVGSLNVSSSQTPPTNANDTCTAGDFIPTTGFIYFCVATDTWQRVAIATWP